MKQNRKKKQIRHQQEDLSHIQAEKWSQTMKIRTLLSRAGPSQFGGPGKILGGAPFVQFSIYYILSSVTR